MQLTANPFVAITKVEKGLYAPVEDDKTPVPKRYRFDDDEMIDPEGRR